MQSSEIQHSVNFKIFWGGGGQEGRGQSAWVFLLTREKEPHKLDSSHSTTRSKLSQTSYSSKMLSFSIRLHYLLITLILSTQLIHIAGVVVLITHLLFLFPLCNKFLTITHSVSLLKAREKTHMWNAKKQCKQEFNCYERLLLINTWQDWLNWFLGSICKQCSGGLSSSSQNIWLMPWMSRNCRVIGKMGMRSPLSLRCKTWETI